MPAGATPPRPAAPVCALPRALAVNLYVRFHALSQPTMCGHADPTRPAPLLLFAAVLFIVGLVATILVVVLVSYIAGNAVRKELKAAKEEIDDEDGEGDDAAADQGDHAASGEEKRSLTPPQV